VKQAIICIIFFLIYDFLLRAYLSNIIATKELDTYAQVILDPNWQKAMDEEFSALQLNQTWTLTHRYPLGKNPSDANESIK